MNWDTIEGNWKEFKGEVKAKWAELTDDDIGEIEGNREILVGKIQQKYGKTREEAEDAVDNWKD